MSNLIITDKYRFFVLDYNSAHNLELKLNVSSKGHELKHYGDILFDFASKNTDKRLIEVSSIEYNFLNMLNEKKTWQECRGI